MKAAIQWICYYLHFAYYTFLMALKKKVLNKKHTDLWPDVRAWANASLSDFGINVKIISEESYQGPLPKGQVIFVANHRSWFDHVSLMTLLDRPFHILAKGGFFKIPVLGTFFRLIEAIPVTDKKLASKEYDDLHRYFSQKESFFLFFEGTRGSGKTLLPFRKGAFHYSAKYKIPLIPIYVMDTERLLSKEKSLLTVSSGTIKVIFDKPFQMTHENFDEEFKNFEAHYRRRHDELYDRFVTL